MQNGRMEEREKGKRHSSKQPKREENPADILNSGERCVIILEGCARLALQLGVKSRHYLIPAEGGNADNKYLSGYPAALSGHPTGHCIGYNALWVPYGGTD